LRSCIDVDEETNKQIEVMLNKQQKSLFASLPTISTSTTTLNLRVSPPSLVVWSNNEETNQQKQSQQQLQPQHNVVQVANQQHQDEINNNNKDRSIVSFVADMFANTSNYNATMNNNNKENNKENNNKDNNNDENKDKDKEQHQVQQRQRKNLLHTALSLALFQLPGDVDYIQVLVAFVVTV
jgi:hypothetical protein